MEHFLLHCERGKRGPSSNLWCCFLWRTSFLFCTYDLPHSGQRCCSTGIYFCGAEVINGWPVVSTSISPKIPITLPSVTADISICNMESSDLVSNLSGMTLVNCQKERSPRSCSGSEHGTAQGRNSHALWFGTQKNRASVFLSFYRDFQILLDSDSPSYHAWDIYNIVTITKFKIDTPKLLFFSPPPHPPFFSFLFLKYTTSANSWQ